MHRCACWAFACALVLLTLEWFSNVLLRHRQVDLSSEGVWEPSMKWDITQSLNDFDLHSRAGLANVRCTCRTKHYPFENLQVDG